MRIIRGQLDDQRRQVLGDAVRVFRRLRDQHLGDARDLGRGLGHLAAVVAGDQQVHIARQLLRRGDRVERRALERGVVVFG